MMIPSTYVLPSAGKGALWEQPAEFGRLVGVGLALASYLVLLGV